MLTMMNYSDAMDIIDTYGPFKRDWPVDVRDDIQALFDSDDDFRDEVKEARRIEKMLDDWDESEDGAEVEDDELDSPGGCNGMDEDDQDDQILAVDPGAIMDADGMFQQAIQKYVGMLDRHEFRPFTRDYDRLIEITAPDHISTQAIDTAVQKATGALQKDIRRLLAARSQSKRIPGKRSGRLHSPNLHRVLSGDDRVFTRREEAQSLSTAVSLVIDCSGSMQGARMKLACETAYALASTLHRVDIAFECLGFTDEHDHPSLRQAKFKQELAEAMAVNSIARYLPLIMPKFKAFDERLTPAIQRRFAALHAGGYANKVTHGFQMGSTPEGCGMEFAARRLLNRPENRKIMFVMTDGEPCGSTANHPLGGRAYTQQSRDMVKAIEAAGIDLVGVGIMHGGPTAYYTNSLIVNNVEEMPVQLLKVLKGLMLSKK